MRATLPDQFAHALRSGRKARGWCLWTLVVVGLAFVLLVSVAASHHHTTAATAQDCALCTAVADKLDNGSPPPLLAVPRLLSLSYSLGSVAVQLVSYASPTLLPPSCGPPASI